MQTYEVILHYNDRTPTYKYRLAATDAKSLMRDFVTMFVAWDRVSSFSITKVEVTNEYPKIMGEGSIILSYGECY